MRSGGFSLISRGHPDRQKHVAKVTLEGSAWAATFESREDARKWISDKTFELLEED